MNSLPGVRYRRTVTVAGVAAVLTVTGAPLLSGTAYAATVSPSPSSAQNNGTVAVTLTASATMFSATGATLIKHDTPSYTIPATGLSNPNVQQPTKRTATFPLLNKLPGVYDITVNEPAGNETCTSCFTVIGLPPSVNLSPPTSVVTGSTAPGTLTLSNPARGADYAKTRIRIEMSGVPNLHKAQMTLTADLGGGPTPVTLDESAGTIFGYIGPQAGTHVGQNQTFNIPLVFGVVSGAPTGTLSITTIFGDVNPATGVSCRQQIAHGTGRAAHHPVELVQAAR